jgi:hypothetical protein
VSEAANGKRAKAGEGAGVRQGAGKGAADCGNVGDAPDDALNPPKPVKFKPKTVAGSHVQTVKSHYDDGRAEIRLELPLDLKLKLVEDWEAVTQGSSPKLVQLPKKVNVSQILDGYARHVDKKACAELLLASVAVAALATVVTCIVLLLVLFAICTAAAAVAAAVAALWCVACAAFPFGASTHLHLTREPSHFLIGWLICQRHACLCHK